MGDRGQIKDADIDGPLAIDVAIDPDSVQVKGIKSNVAGDADCLVFPQLEASNILIPFSPSPTKRLSPIKAIP